MSNLKTGEWKLETMPAISLPSKVKEAFDSALNCRLGVVYIPVLYVAHQVVNGMNYCIICREEKVVLHPVGSCKIVHIYAPIEGQSCVTKMVDLIS